ncbi:protein SRC2 homolog [Hibiscus syriacus]|uniref:protein SRC2 homolog n=1 Tax=Hibiscus syriacus TaxID=106335 RepID=UPI001924C8F3|nr:protein SRC2 homolog [Hibiscus syriacus]
MESRILEINVNSAEVFNDVNVFTPTTDAHVVVSINGDHRSSERTPIGGVRGSSCYWNHTVKFIGETAVRSLVFRLNSGRRPEDSDIAAVEIPVNEELFHGYNENMTVAQPDGYWKPVRPPVIMYPPTYSRYAMAYPSPNPWWSFGYPPSSHAVGYR